MKRIFKIAQILHEHDYDKSIILKNNTFIKSRLNEFNENNDFKLDLIINRCTDDFLVFTVDEVYVEAQHDLVEVWLDCPIDQKKCDVLIAWLSVEVN